MFQTLNFLLGLLAKRALANRLNLRNSLSESGLRDFA